MSRGLAVTVAAFTVDLVFAADAGAHGQWWLAAWDVFLCVVVVKIHEYTHPVPR